MDGKPVLGIGGAAGITTRASPDGLQHGKAGGTTHNRDPGRSLSPGAGMDELDNGKLFSTVSATDLVTQIARQITQAIVAGRLKPGQRLTELQLSKDFGTSRAPVREAARLLESQGLVVSSPRRGFFVRTLTAYDLRDLYELRIGLELHAGELAIERASDEAIDGLRRQIDTLYTLADDGSVERQIFEDFEFHRMALRGGRQCPPAQGLRRTGKRDACRHHAHRQALR